MLAAELGSGHAMVDRADSNAAEKCCGSLAKHYNIYVWLKPICVTYHVHSSQKSAFCILLPRSDVRAAAGCVARCSS